jgi:heme/copper-type cytochrome/quinol oxidase subunit 4
VSEDPVLGLEKLAELHRSGELSDTEFDDAKRELLHHGAAVPLTRPPAPAPSALAALEPSAAVGSLSQDAGSRPRRAGIALAGRWKLAVIAMVVVGFVLGIALLIVAEVAPSSAQWTKGFVCAAGEQLFTNGGVVHSNGGSAQGATHFYCTPAGQPVTGLELLSLPEKTGAVLGLSFLLGFLIAAVLTVVTIVVLSWRSRARATPR